jgi:predicted permease
LALRPDAIVALIAIPLVGLLAGLLAIIPVTMSRRRDLLASLRRSVSAPPTTGGRSLRGGLIVVQVAISLALLINCGLMVASAHRLRQIDVGFVAEGLGVGRLLLPEPRYAGDARLIAFFDDLLARLRVHGVKQAAVVSHAPFRSARANARRFRADAADGTIVEQDASTFHVSTGFFEAMRIPLVAGEVFRNERDVAVVSVSFANRAWPGERGLGKTIRSGDDLELTVIGIVGEVLNSLTDPDLSDVYVPMVRSPWSSVEVIARTDDSGPAAVAALRRTLAELDADLPLGRGESMTDAIGRQTGRSDFLAVLLLLFGATAVALVVVALYGAVAYTVSQRSREIAIRVALGGTPGSIEAIFLRWGMLLVGLGVCVGLVSSIFLSKALAGQLHGVTPMEPSVYAALCMLLIAVTLAAVWLPARRASRIEPMAILRAE